MAPPLHETAGCNVLSVRVGQSPTSISTSAPTPLNGVTLKRQTETLRVA